MNLAAAFAYSAGYAAAIAGDPRTRAYQSTHPDTWLAGYDQCQAMARRVAAEDAAKGKAPSAGEDVASDDVARDDEKANDAPTIGALPANEGEVVRYCDPSQPGTPIGLRDSKGNKLHCGDTVRDNNANRFTNREYWNPLFRIVWDAPSYGLVHIGGGRAGDNIAFLLKNSTLELVRRYDEPATCEEEAIRLLKEGMSEAHYSHLKASGAHDQVVAVLVKLLPKEYD